MKEKQLREVSKCDLCGNKIGATGIPLFFRIRVQRYGLDARACQRQQGLGLMLGGALAQVMGPDEDLAKKMNETELTACMSCACERAEPIAVLEEKGTGKAKVKA